MVPKDSGPWGKKQGVLFPELCSSECSGFSGSASF